MIVIHLFIDCFNNKLYGTFFCILQSLWNNVIGAAAILVWSGTCSVVLFGVLRTLGLLRVSEEEELQGQIFIFTSKI